MLMDDKYSYHLYYYTLNSTRVKSEKNLLSAETRLAAKKETRKSFHAKLIKNSASQFSLLFDE